MTVCEPLSVIRDLLGVKGLLEFRSFGFFGRSGDEKKPWIDLCCHILRSASQRTKVRAFV